MALTFSKLFQPQQLGNAVATIYTMPALSTAILKNGRVRLTNTDSSPHAVTLYAVPSGGSPSATNMFVSAMSIAANSYVDVDVPTLASSDLLEGFADTAAKVSIHEIGGVIYT